MSNQQNPVKTSNRQQFQNLTLTINIKKKMGFLMGSAIQPKTAPIPQNLPESRSTQITK